MQEEIELWQTRVHPDSSFVVPLQPAKKKNTVDDGSDDVNFSLWLVTDDEEEADDTIEELPEMAQGPLNQDLGASDDTISELSMADSSSVAGNSQPAQAQCSKNHADSIFSAATVDATSQSQANITRGHQDTCLNASLPAVSMVQFVENEEEYESEGAMFNNQLGTYSTNTFNQTHYPHSNWLPDTSFDQEQFPYLAEAIPNHQSSIDLSILTLPRSENAFGTDHPTWADDYQYQLPTEGELYNTLNGNNSRSDIEYLINSSDCSSEVDDSFGLDSPTFRKECRRQASLGQMDAVSIGDLSHIMRIMGADAWSSAFGPRVVTQAESDNDEEQIQEEEVEDGDLSKEGLTAICSSYVSEHYYPPSNEAAIILPRHSQPSEEVTAWLDQKIAQMKESDATKGFDGPQVRHYDPLGDLTPENEKHEAGRCLHAAGLIFQQDITGQSDWYDHGMAGAYHFIPKSETDKWNDDSNFIVSDQEFEELIDDMYTDKKACTKQSDGNTDKVAEDVTVKDAVTALSTNVSEQSAKDIEPFAAEEAVHHQVSLDQAVRQSQPWTKKETIHERVPNLPTNQAESSPRKENIPKNIHLLTPTRGPKRKVARLDTTPHYNPSAVEPFGSMSSADSFKTARGTPQVMSSSPQLPIPSFHADRPSTPNRKTSRQSEGGNDRQGAYEKKTTRNIFAVVENRTTSTHGSRSSCRSLPRTIQPSPPEGYSARNYQGYSRNAPGSPGSPTPLGKGNSRFTSSFMPATSNNQGLAPQPAIQKPGPKMATFYPHPGPRGQQSQQFGDRQFDPSAGNYHLDTRNSRVGNREQTGFSQVERNGGHGYSSYSVPTNNVPHHIAPSMQYQAPAPRHMEPHQMYAVPTNNLQRHIAPSMQSQAPAPRRMERHHMYAGNMHEQYSHMSPGNQSSDSTISAASQFHSPHGISRQGNQHATPCKNKNDPSPSPLMATQQSNPRTPGDFDCTPIKFDLPPSFKSTSREKAVIMFPGHKQCAMAMTILQTAAKASPEMNIMFTETFENKPTTIILSAPAGKMIRGWVKNLLPNAYVEASMAQVL